MMCKKNNYLKVVLLIIVALYVVDTSQSIATIASSRIDVCFTPGGNCTDAIINELDSAKSEILAQAYSFTSAPIAAALVRAHKRGVVVKVILDKSQDRKGYSSATFLHNAGIQTYIDSAHAIAHNKIMIIDQETVITGSFNFTSAAEKKTLKTS